MGETSAPLAHCPPISPSPQRSQWPRRRCSFGCWASSHQDGREDASSVIFEDNKACISISTGDTDKKRTKHIAKHWHFVKEKCAAGLVVLKYLETALQVADMFTKQIFPKHFERLRRVMMGHENFDDMQARYVQVKASGDDMDDPKLYVDSKPGRPPK